MVNLQLTCNLDLLVDAYACSKLYVAIVLRTAMHGLPGTPTSATYE